MLLAIDAGNTNIVFALVDGEDIRAQWRISTTAERTSDEFAVWLTNLMALRRLAPASITGAVIASVVPRATPHLERLVRDHFGCAPLVVGAPDVDLGIEIKIDLPQEAGADRLANAVAAKRHYSCPAVVLDVGTMTNFDVVDDDGNFFGGIIALGPSPSVDVLHRVAAKLPRIDIARPDRVIGKGTIGAMQSGVYWGYVGMIEGLLDRIQTEYGSPMTIIATGGLAGLFHGVIDAVGHVDHDITIKGLIEIYQRNRLS